jgi:hypothetical protein
VRFLAILALVVALFNPLAAKAAEKDPLAYPLKQYGFILAVALLGGLVSWYGKVRAGTLQAFNVMALVGELATSALAGLIAFWLCEYMGFNPALEAALVGIAGHMGTRAITAFESFAQRKWGTPSVDMEAKP